MVNQFCDFAFFLMVTTLDRAVYTTAI